VNGSEAAAPSNIIRLAERVQARLEKNIPLLEASGVLLEPWEGKSLSGDLKNTDCTLGVVVAELTKRATADRDVARLRTAALLYRVQGEVRLATKRAEKLERKLAKAKRRITKLA
jgi:hypothetical protein